MKPARSGHTLIEAMVTLLVLGATLAAVAHGARLLGDQQRRLNDYQVALWQAENVLEQIVQMPWEELSQPRADEVAASWLATQTLNGQATAEFEEIRFVISIDEQAGPPVSKRIVVTRLHGSGNTAFRGPEVKLTTWVSSDAQQNGAAR